MTDSSSQGQYSTREIVAGVGTYAAAAVLLVSAVASILQGISALANDQLVVGGQSYLYRFNTTAWGWILIVTGVLVAAVACGLFWATRGHAWVRSSSPRYRF
jgi:ABC-type nickel/cobalt efflux system permease component RcnA